MAKKTEPEALLERHANLVHSEMQKVTSHVQRRAEDWFVNTLMIEGCAAPFRYRRKRKYKNLEGSLVNLTYYADRESVAGIEIETMKVVRIRRA